MHSESLNNASSPYEPAHIPKRLNKREEIIQDYDYSELLFLKGDEYDDSIIGVSRRIGQEDVIAYDYNKICAIVAKLIGTDDIMEVMDYVNTNITGAYVGERTPVFVDVL